METEDLTVGFLDDGDPRGRPVVLLHGFPYDVLSYQAVVPALTAVGLRVIVPWLRGYGPTRIRDSASPRSGQQAALGSDLRDLIARLDLDRPVLAGYDWGGRAACVVAARWPEMIRGLVSCGTGYNIQDAAIAAEPALAETEHRHWYWYYFDSRRGTTALRRDRATITRYLWRTFSPTWDFSDATFAATAASFDNPDFVEVVLHSYRYRIGATDGVPALEGLERALARSPVITTPTVVLQGASDAVDPPQDRQQFAAHFTDLRRVTTLNGVGHNLPQEDPASVAEAVIQLVGAE